MSYVRKFPKDVEKTRTIPFVFSDETRDSYGTVFTADGWDLDRFNKNGIALFNHNTYSSDPDMSIGTARAWVEGKKLLGEITFEPADINPLAEKVFRKYLNGTYKGVSVRFFPLENGHWGKGQEDVTGENPTYYIGRRELIEISVVPIPSNKNALTRSHEAELTTEVQKDEVFFTDGNIRYVDVEEEEPESDQPADNAGNTTPDVENIIINAYRALGGLR